MERLTDLTLDFLKDLEPEDCYIPPSGLSYKSRKSLDNCFAIPAQQREPSNERNNRLSVASSTASSRMSISSQSSASSGIAPGCFKLQCEYMGRVHKWIFPGDREMTVHRVRKTIKRKFPDIRDDFRVKYLDQSHQDLITICDDSDLDDVMAFNGVVIVQ